MKFFQKYKRLIILSIVSLLIVAALYFFVWKQEVKAETVENKNVQAFLKMIRDAEGTAGANGYRTLFGGGLFTSFAAHPKKRFEFKQKDGKKNYTDAAGAYQFLSTTWAVLASRLSLPDFSPESQDKGAIELIREKGALNDVIAGNFEAAVKKISPIWASMPYNKAPQPHKTLAHVQEIYKQNGGFIV